MVRNPLITWRHVYSELATITRRDALFFITNVDDTKVILGAKTCQELGLVKIVCDDWCQCKSMEVMLINQEFPIGLSVPDVKPRIILPPVDLNTKIDFS